MTSFTRTNVEFLNHIGKHIWLVLCIIFTSVRSAQQSGARRGRMIPRHTKVAVCVSALCYDGQIRCHGFIKKAPPITISRRGRMGSSTKLPHSTSPRLLHYSIRHHLKGPARGVGEKLSKQLSLNLTVSRDCRVNHDKRCKSVRGAIPLFCFFWEAKVRNCIFFIWI